MHDPAIREYRVERLDKDNLKDLDALYTAVYGHAPPEFFFLKKYDTAWTGAGYLGYFAYNDHDISVAYYGVMPCFMEYKGELILSAQSGDTMTHPEYRNRGLFVTLCNKTIDLCRKEKIRLLFGFPNQQSLPGFVNKLGWIRTETMDCFIIPVRAIQLASLANRFPFLKKIYAIYSSAILKKITLPQQGLPGPAMNGSPGGLHRDDAYFSYKTYSITQVIRAGEAKAWIRTNNTLIIGDLELQGQSFDRTINMLKKTAARLGLRQLFFHGSPGTPLHRLFAAHYPAIPSFPVIFRDLGAEIPLNELKFTFADIDTF